MLWTDLLLLLGAGVVGGFVAGLIGVGGGIIFAPVLFFYFQHQGIAADVLTPLTLGSSLLCTLIAALSSAWFQHRRGAVVPRVVLAAGLSSAVAVFLTTRFVTTRPWYDAQVFQVAFSLILLVVAGRMLRSPAPLRKGDDQPAGASSSTRSTSWLLLGGIGTAAGVVSSAVGVGGGVVLVPAYAGALRLPIRLAVGTSSATIVLIALVGVVTYAAAGWSAPSTPPFAVGYVDAGHALLLALPAVLSARLGVRLAHRIDTRLLRWSFSLLAAIVAVRLLLRALG